MEKGLQRSQTTQQLWAYTARNIRRKESPVNWRFFANIQQYGTNQLTLQPWDFWNLDWYGDWGQVIIKKRMAEKIAAKRLVIFKDKQNAAWQQWYSYARTKYFSVAAACINPLNGIDR